VNYYLDFKLLNMKQPNFSYQDIKYSIDQSTISRAENLFKSNKVQNISEYSRGYNAVVQGTSPYHVNLSYRSIEESSCDCYMGQNDYLCKHILALAFAILKLSGKKENVENISPNNIEDAKLLVSKGLKFIKSYNGSSRSWFSYQHDLYTGSVIIEDAIKNLQPNKENSKYIWSIALKLSKKLSNGGVDDSDGTVGGLIISIVNQCAKYANKNPQLKILIKDFTKDYTGFGFEEILMDLLENS